MKLIFLLADTQQWIDEMSRQAFLPIPIDNKKKLFRKDYWLGITAMAHILERHYYKIPRHPEAGKFHIPIPEILYHIREARCINPTPVNGSLNFKRLLCTEEPIGFDKGGHVTNTITIITDAGGKIISAFPGMCN